MLSRPDEAGSLARLSFGLVNLFHRSRLYRFLMEKVLGIHREKLLPDFASTTFERWAERTGRIAKSASPSAPEVVLFQTCYVQNNEPAIGRDTLEVLDRNRVRSACVSGLVCCGMPAWETGDLETMRRQAKRNLEILLPFVEAGSRVVAINPTCAMMMRREYPSLVALEDRVSAGKLAAAVSDPSEFLWTIRKDERFNTDFKSSPGDVVAYHAPCHLRAQGVGFKARDLLKKIPGVAPRVTMECCGHDGTHAMKVEGFEYSKRVGQKAFDEMKSHGAEIWVTDCPLAALQFRQHASVSPMHPMTVLARAYRGDGFGEDPR
jgi:Fe-S oxidoreductase